MSSEVVTVHLWHLHIRENQIEGWVFLGITIAGTACVQGIQGHFSILSNLNGGSRFSEVKRDKSLIVRTVFGKKNPHALQRSSVVRIDLRTR